MSNVDITVADRAIARVKSRALGRTRYAGQEAFDDETLVSEIERLRLIVADYEAAAAKIEANPLLPNQYLGKGEG